MVPISVRAKALVRVKQAEKNSICHNQRHSRLLRPNRPIGQGLVGAKALVRAEALVRAIIQTFKSMTTHKINALQKTPGGMVWQRNYYKHIIHSEEEWERIRLYIQVNPLRWAEDDENPSAAMR
jgi:REP element-mobilizing transposase RayT